MQQEELKELIFKLRELTGAGLYDSKKALIACDGNINEAIKYLKFHPIGCWIYKKEGINDDRRTDAKTHERNRC